MIPYREIIFRGLAHSLHPGYMVKCFYDYRERARMENISTQDYFLGLESALKELFDDIGKPISLLTKNRYSYPSFFTLEYYQEVEATIRGTAHFSGVKQIFSKTATPEKGKINYTGVILLYKLLYEFTNDEKWEITKKNAARICKEYKLSSKNYLLKKLKDFIEIDYSNKTKVSARPATVIAHYEQLQMILPILQIECILAYNEAKRRLKLLPEKYPYVKN